MPSYQFFQLDIGGRIGLGVTCDCVDAEHALRLAEGISKGVHQVDVWQGLEHVGRVEAPTSAHRRW